jgi:hypothetical protein
MEEEHHNPMASPEKQGKGEAKQIKNKTEN